MTASAIATPVDDAPSLPPRAPSLLARLAGKSFWALADQAVASIGNFATTILVAQHISHDQLGVYQLLTEMFLFVNGIQGALLIYPLSVRGAVLDKPAMQRLATACLILTGLLCIPLTLTMAGATVIFSGVGVLILFTACAVLFQQLQETVRRLMLAHLRFREAIVGDSISYVAQAALLYYFGRHLTLPAIFAIMAGTSAAALAVQACQVGLRAFPLAELKPLWLDFWSISRWAFYSVLGTLIASLSYNWVLAWRWHFTPVGSFAVIANMAKIVNPITSAIGNLIVPTVARARAGGGVRFAMKVGLKYATLGAGMLFPYFAILLILPRFCIWLLYGSRHPEYLDLDNYLRVLVCSWTLMFTTNMLISVLNGLGYSRVGFIATLTNALVTALVALPLVYRFGLPGTIAGGFLATAAGAIAALWCFIRHHNDAAATPAQT